MSSVELRLLDCTLRDGGYVNHWKWGFHCARAIIRCLVRADIDFVEIGFLKDTDKYNEDVTVCNTIEELNSFIPENSSDACFSAMAMNGAYDIKKLTPYSGSGIQLIRVTAHEYDLEEGMKFAQQIKKLGYLVSINPINIMGYNDEKILQIIDRVNEIHPYQFSIVDTFGSMKRKDLNRIISMADHNLARDIRLGLHLHENMSLSCSLAQQFADMHLNRPAVIDGSLFGMGRTPGNLPIELIADYLNEYAEKKYDIDYLLDAIQDYIEPIKGNSKWGYTPSYFLSAKYGLHRSYAEYYMRRGDLSNRDISHILASFDKGKTTAFDQQYAQMMYLQYKNNEIDDEKIIDLLKAKFYGRKILLMAPGASLRSERKRIETFIKTYHPLVISVNFIPEIFECDFTFFSNGKRFVQVSGRWKNLILTSNIESDETLFKVNYNRLSGAFSQGYNSLVMAMKLLKEIGIEKCAVAGADGYVDGKKHYYKSSLKRITEEKINYNFEVKQAVRMLKIDVEYITESAYE